MNWRMLGNSNLRKSAIASLCLIFAMVVGCGASDTTTHSTPDTTSTQGTDSDSPQNLVDDGGASSKTSSGSEATNGATPEGGLQMPEVDVPVEATGTDSTSGPAKAGSGGLDLPDVEIPPAETVIETDQQSSAASIKVQFASWADIHQQAKSTGKVTVVDLWSLACDPCIKEFPGLVSIDKKQNGKVTCIGVNVDYYGSKRSPPETFEKDATAFLSAVNARFDNFICTTSSDEIYEKLELVSIPAVIVFDANGKEVKRFVDAGDGTGFTYEKDIIPLVEQMIAENS